MSDSPVQDTVDEKSANQDNLPPADFLRKRAEEVGLPQDQWPSDLKTADKKQEMWDRIDAHEMKQANDQAERTRQFNPGPHRDDGQLKVNITQPQGHKPLSQSEMQEHECGVPVILVKHRKRLVEYVAEYSTQPERAKMRISEREMDAYERYKKAWNQIGDKTEGKRPAPLHHFVAARKFYKAGAPIEKPKLPELSSLNPD